MVWYQKVLEKESPTLADFRTEKQKQKQAHLKEEIKRRHAVVDSGRAEGYIDESIALERKEQIAAALEAESISYAWTDMGKRLEMAIPLALRDTNGIPIYSSGQALLKAVFETPANISDDVARWIAKDLEIPVEYLSKYRTGEALPPAPAEVPALGMPPVANPFATGGRTGASPGVPGGTMNPSKPLTNIPKPPPAPPTEEAIPELPADPPAPLSLMPEEQKLPDPPDLPFPGQPMPIPVGAGIQATASMLESVSVQVRNGSGKDQFIQWGMSGDKRTLIITLIDKIAHDTDLNQHHLLPAQVRQRSKGLVETVQDSINLDFSS